MGEHPCSIRRSADFSVVSTANRHRNFTAIHVLAYAQIPRSGNHSAGSRSDLLRLDEAETAMRAPA